MHPRHSALPILASILLDTTCVHAVLQDAWWRVDTSSPSSACYLTIRNGHSCITDGTGNHENDESCTFTIMQDAVVQAIQYEVETGRDYVTINGTEFKGGPQAPPINVPMKQNEQLTWHADSTATYGGFTICAYSSAAPLMPPPPPPVPAPPPSPSQPPYPPGMAPPIIYMLKSSGECERPIGSVADCSLAANALGLTDTIADNDFQGAGNPWLAFDPPRCYQEWENNAWSLKYNDGANSGQCTAKDQCLCYGSQPPSSPPTPPSPPPPSFPPAQPGVLMNIVSGSNFCELITMSNGPLAGAECLTDGADDYGRNEHCKVVVTSNIIVTAIEYLVEECIFGCDYLTLDNTRYQHNNAPTSVHLDAGAIIEWKSDDANQRAGFTLCAELPSDPKTPPPSPLPPPPPPHLPNQAPIGTFHLREFGTCPFAQVVDTLEGCNAAAQSLSLADSTAESDPPSGADPPWCYFENGVLKFNVDGTNTGSCSATDKCICTGVQAPATPPPPPPPSAPKTSSFRIKSGNDHCHFTSSPPLFGGAFDCVTDGLGNHGHLEDCEIEIMHDAKLVSVQYAVEEGGYDYLEIGGVRYSNSSFDNLVMRVGDTIKWHTDVSVVSKGFTICAGNMPRPSPPPTPPPSPLSPVLFPPPSAKPSLSPPVAPSPLLVGDSDAQSASKPPGPSTGIVAGAMVGGVAVLAIIVVLVALLLRKRAMHAMRLSTTKIVETVPAKSKLVDGASGPVDAHTSSVSTKTAMTSYPDEYVAQLQLDDDIENGTRL